jgi:hypothetical protein
MVNFDGKLIGLVGAAQTGKSTIAGYLVKNHGFVRHAFMDALKAMLIKAGMCTYDECYSSKTLQSRWLMQKVGTEIFIEQIDPLFWVRQTEKKLKELLENGRSVVVDDIRRPKEAAVIRKLGGILARTVREDFVDDTAGSEHESERYVNQIPVDFVINAKSGDLEKLLNMAEMLAGLEIGLQEELRG